MFDGRSHQSDMPGNRIFHPTARNERIQLDHKGGLEDGRIRAPKAYVINVDADGFSIVSDVVWERIQQAQAQNTVHADHRFMLTNVVASPPKLAIGQGGSGDGIMVPRTRRLNPDGSFDDVTQEWVDRVDPVKSARVQQGIDPHKQ